MLNDTVIQVPAEGIMEAARVVKLCMENAVKLRQDTNVESRNSMRLSGPLHPLQSYL
jgi:hypothetical protein